jgi:hypothetical protein
MSEANVEIIRRHYEIRHGKRGKRREVAAAASLLAFAAFPARPLVGFLGHVHL